MSRYRKIDTRMWSDSKFNNLSPIKPSGQSLFQYLLTARESTMLPGMMRMSEAGTAEFLGWSMRAFRKCWREIEAQNLAKADWKRQFVWLPNAIKYNEPANPNVVKGWFKHYDELPECELREVALRNLYDFILSRSSEFRKAFEKAFAEPLAKGLRKQEQEQKQKQQSPPHRTAVDTSSGDATTDEEAGGGAGFAFENIAHPAEVLDAVGEFETATEPVSEPPPIEQPPLVETMPQTPAQGPEQRPWRVGRPLDGLPDSEVLTTLDIDKALRAAGYIRGTVGTHAWGQLGKVHEASPLTAGELQNALRLAEDPKVVTHLAYMAGCIERRRNGLDAPGAVRRAPVTASRAVEYEHEKRERIVNAWLALQRDQGYERDEDRACREAERGMPADEDRERYARHGGSYASMDRESNRVTQENLAMIMDSLAGRMSMPA